MNENILELFKKNRHKNLIIDTNIFLLYLIGSYNLSLIRSFKRTMHFAVEDYHTLEKVINFFNKIIVTPNILTEVNSLSNQLPEKIKNDFFITFKEKINSVTEKFIESKTLSENNLFSKFGLTDTSILKLVEERIYLLLTDDFKLSQFLQNKGIDAINFNHIRPLFWQ